MSSTTFTDGFDGVAPLQEKPRWQQWRERPADMDDSDVFCPIFSGRRRFSGEEATDGISFFPSACVQRYQAVMDVIGQEKYRRFSRKLVDFGCNDCRFLKYLTERLGTVKQLVGVDIDPDALQNTFIHNAMAMESYDRVQQHSVEVDLFLGSVLNFDSRMADVDIITCVELVEHLQTNQLDRFAESIFHDYKPLLVIVTTPNSEFNELFHFQPDKQFRHWDHKFEWTRQQFQDWADSVCVKYSDYQVEFYGIASGPPGSEPLGCCSQMAVFRRRSSRNYNAEKADLMAKVDTMANPYQKVATVYYQSAHSYKVWCESVGQEALKVCRWLAYDQQPYWLNGQSYVDISTDKLMEELSIQKLCSSKEQLNHALVTMDLPSGWGFYSGQNGLEGISCQSYDSVDYNDNQSEEEE